MSLHLVVYTAFPSFVGMKSGYWTFYDTVGNETSLQLCLQLIRCWCIETTFSGRLAGWVGAVGTLISGSEIQAQCWVWSLVKRKKRTIFFGIFSTFPATFLNCRTVLFICLQIHLGFLHKSSCQLQITLLSFPFFQSLSFTLLFLSGLWWIGPPLPWTFLFCSPS